MVTTDDLLNQLTANLKRLEANGDLPKVAARIAWLLGADDDLWEMLKDGESEDALDSVQTAFRAMQGNTKL
jgi:hypothetical protein